MKPEWHTFLQNAGAEFEDQTVSSFGNIPREQRMIHTGLVMCDLSHLGIISAYGEDAADFLQGQLTNDIRDVSIQHSQLSACCTAKGRMLSNFRIFKREETFYLRLPLEQLESTLKRLHMFMLMSKLTLENASDSLVHIGVSGPTAESELASHISELPDQIDDVTQSDGYTVIRLPGIHPRFEIHAELEAMQKLWNHLDVNAAAIGAGPWNLLDILSGIPTIYPETSEAFVPQMANMQVINGVSFQKGCYTGQEIVARMQYLGKLKRHMYRIYIETNDEVKPGDALYSPESKSGQGTGTIVDAQLDAVEGGYEALAVIDVNDAEKNMLQLINENGPKIILKELPYSIDVQSES
jgi:tRNA-modifying protein YgfZ